MKIGIGNESLIATMLYHCLLGLDYLHNQGYIHRDIKAANILINEDGSIKLCDLGVSTQLTYTRTRASSVAGTPFWMAPEVISSNNSSHGYKSYVDIWSLGITAIELAQGYPPYANFMNPQQAMFAIPSNDPPKLVGNFSVAFKLFVSLCLKKDPFQRATIKTLLNTKFIKKANKDTTTLIPLIEKYEEKQRILEEQARLERDDDDETDTDTDSNFDSDSSEDDYDTFVENDESKAMGWDFPEDTLSDDRYVSSGSAHTPNYGNLTIESNHSNSVADVQTPASPTTPTFQLKRSKRTSLTLSESTGLSSISSNGSSSDTDTANSLSLEKPVVPILQPPPQKIKKKSPIPVTTTITEENPIIKSDTLDEDSPTLVEPSPTKKPSPTTKPSPPKPEDPARGESIKVNSPPSKKNAQNRRVFLFPEDFALSLNKPVGPPSRLNLFRKTPAVGQSEDRNENIVYSDDESSTGSLISSSTEELESEINSTSSLHSHHPPKHRREPSSTNPPNFDSSSPHGFSVPVVMTTKPTSDAHSQTRVRDSMLARVSVSCQTPISSVGSISFVPSKEQELFASKFSDVFLQRWRRKR
eukprot:CAMPEP_0117429644 /NCGR_PEP_ID=MMETSP0758-20121206/9169_1 /TAXON_ID=63605 /ORGANISM="Percolomonas cosmopolitus, Strain AE-1 (ATCC 50343)" /LENGTH=584 /DNA_ID=CAMNT_0005216841 /DNA_START=296 /DNA_END=2046 /DNA_ORIENTATION=+